MGPLESKAAALAAFDYIDADWEWAVKHLVTPRQFKAWLRDQLDKCLDLKLGLERIDARLPPEKRPQRK